MPMSLDLITPQFALLEDYRMMLGESIAAGEDEQLGYLQRLLDRIGRTPRDYQAYLDQLAREAREHAAMPGPVPQTTFWLVRDRFRVLGESRLRHTLTPSLHIEGGHIGYFIRRSERRQGYGIEILARMLDEARAIALDRVLVTCDRDNVGSVRIIEENGGQWSGEGVSPRTGKVVWQYWIVL